MQKWYPPTDNNIMKKMKDMKNMKNKIQDKSNSRNIDLLTTIQGHYSFKVKIKININIHYNMIMAINQINKVNNHNKINKSSMMSCRQKNNNKL